MSLSKPRGNKRIRKNSSKSKKRVAYTIVPYDPKAESASAIQALFAEIDFVTEHAYICDLIAQVNDRAGKIAYGAEWNSLMATLANLQQDRIRVEELIIKRDEAMRNPWKFG